MKRFDAPSSDSESYYSSSAVSSSVSSSRPRQCDAKKRRADGGVGLAPSGLLMNQLAMMDDGEAKDESLYAEKGKSKERIQAVLNTRCCKKSCKRNLPLRLVMNMVMLFWSLPKASQDCLLWSMQQAGGAALDDGSDSDSSGSEAQRKISWSIEGRSKGLRVDV